MKILVTGGAGFMGSEFVRQGIKRKHEIIVVDKITYAGDEKRLESVKEKINFQKTDILNKAALNKIFEKEKPEWVVHWAAETHVDRSILDSNPFIETNVVGTNNILEMCKNHGVQKIINTATDEVYGALGKNGEFLEDTPLNPSSPYSASKAAADMLGKAYYRTYNLPVITIRPSNFYGPWQYPEKLIPVMVYKAYKNEQLPVYGKGDNVREWLFISDASTAVFELLDKGNPGETYNIGSNQEKTNIELVENILDIMGKNKDLISFVQDRPGHDFRYSVNTDKIEKDIGWKAKTNFRTGLEHTVNWYLSNIDWVESKLEETKKLWNKVYK